MGLMIRSCVFTFVYSFCFDLIGSVYYFNCFAGFGILSLNEES